MSIRIHKALGWGLLDVPEDDPRIDWESPLIQRESGRYGRDRYYSYLEKLREGADRWTDPIGEMALIRACEHEGLKLGQPCDRIHFDLEDRETSTFLVQPFSCPDWHRWDDTMDWVQDEMIDDRGLDPHTDLLYANPWPFDSTRMNRHTGERITNQDGTLMTWVRASQIALPPARRRPWKGDLLRALDMLAQEMGLKDHAEAVDTVVPNVPHEIRRLAEFGKVFVDPATVLELRPMLFTYWV